MKNQKCFETISILCKSCKHRHIENCPNEVVGIFTYFDGYENRKYPMCEEHKKQNEPNKRGKNERK